MKQKLTAYQKAGRLMILLGWIFIVVILAVGASILIPAFATGNLQVVQLLLLFVLPIGGSIFYLIVGKAVKEHKGWGRIAGIILAILALSGFPIGTLIGAYVLWCLIKRWNEQQITI